MVVGSMHRIGVCHILLVLCMRLILKHVFYIYQERVECIFKFNRQPTPLFILHCYAGQFADFTMECCIAANICNCVLGINKTFSCSSNILPQWSAFWELNAEWREYILLSLLVGYNWNTFALDSLSVLGVLSSDWQGSYT